MELLPFLCNAGMVSFLFLCKHHITLCFLFTSSIFLPKICNSVHSTVPENAFLIHIMSGSELLLFCLLSCTRKPSIPCTEALVFAHLLHRAPELNRPIGTFASHFQGHVKEVFSPFFIVKQKTVIHWASPLWTSNHYTMISPTVTLALEPWHLAAFVMETSASSFFSCVWTQNTCRQEEFREDKSKTSSLPMSMIRHQNYLKVTQCLDWHY